MRPAGAVRSLVVCMMRGGTGRRAVRMVSAVRDEVRQRRDLGRQQKHDEQERSCSLPDLPERCAAVLHVLLDNNAARV